MTEDEDGPYMDNNDSWNKWLTLPGLWTESTSKLDCHEQIPFVYLQWRLTRISGYEADDSLKKKKNAKNISDSGKKNVIVIKHEKNIFFFILFS